MESSGGAIRDEIARLETRIEALADSIERCRKLAMLARLLIAIGMVWTLLMLARAVPIGPVHMVGAIASMLGGTVLLGSNSSTWKQMLAARAEAELLRSALIDRMELQLVEENPRSMGGT